MNAHSLPRTLPSVRIQSTDDARETDWTAPLSNTTTSGISSKTGVQVSYDPSKTPRLALIGGGRKAPIVKQAISLGLILWGGLLATTSSLAQNGDRSGSETLFPGIVYTQETLQGDKPQHIHIVALDLRKKGMLLFKKDSQVVEKIQVQLAYMRIAHRLDHINAYSDEKGRVCQYGVIILAVKKSLDKQRLHKSPPYYGRLVCWSLLDQMPCSN